MLHALDVRFHRDLTVISFRQDIRQPYQRRPAPTEPPLLPVPGDMPIEYLDKAHLHHLTDEQRHVVDPLGDDHQLAFPKELLGPLIHLHFHALLPYPDWVT